MAERQQHSSAELVRDFPGLALHTSTVLTVFLFWYVTRGIVAVWRMAPSLSRPPCPTWQKDQQIFVGLAASELLIPPDNNKTEGCSG